MSGIQLNVEDVNTILNLKRAWLYILNHLDDKISLDYIERVHIDVAKDEALFRGELRTGRVRIGDTEYIPPIPVRENVIKELDQLLKIENITLQALEIMLWLMKSQLFWDGNKRIANLITNKILIQHGCGVISIPVSELDLFNILLSHYCSREDEMDKKVLLDFLYARCIEGI